MKRPSTIKFTQENHEGKRNLQNETKIKFLKQKETLEKLMKKA